MKRVFLTLVAVLATAAVAAASSTAAVPDPKGPPCTNFIFGDAGYNASTGLVTADMTLAAPACAGATYLLDIYSFDGQTLLQADVVGTASGTLVSFSHTFTSGAPSDGVCLVAESYFHGRLIDRAPESGCLPVDPTSGPSQGGFN